MGHIYTVWRWKQGTSQDAWCGKSLRAEVWTGVGGKLVGQREYTLEQRSK